MSSRAFTQNRYARDGTGSCDPWRCASLHNSFLSHICPFFGLFSAPFAFVIVYSSTSGFDMKILPSNPNSWCTKILKNLQWNKFWRFELKPFFFYPYGMISVSLMGLRLMTDCKIDVRKPGPTTLLVLVGLLVSSGIIWKPQPSCECVCSTEQCSCDIYHISIVVCTSVYSVV